MQKPEIDRPETKPWRTLFCIAIAGLIFGVLGFGEIGDDVLRTARNSFHQHKASGEILVVKIDDPSIQAAGRWPWPRRYHAELVDQLTEAGAKQIFFDIKFYGKTDPRDDEAFARALDRSRRVTLGVAGPSVPLGEKADRGLPLSDFAAHARLGSIRWRYNYQNAVLRAPYEGHVDGRTLPSFSTLLSGKIRHSDDMFPIDYSLDPYSIPTLSAADVLKGSFPASAVRGKTVIVGSTSDAGSDMYFVPGVGKLAGVFIHVMAAETLMAGTPIDLQWIPLFLLAFATAAFAMIAAAERRQLQLIAAVTAVIIVAPMALEARLIFLDVTPALFVLLVTAVILARRRFRKKGLIDAVSGLPNLAALKSQRKGRDKALIVARVLNYSEIVAALPAPSERQLVEQIVARLSVGAQGRTLYQGDGGIFAWFDEPGKPFGHHLEALYALFRTPVRVGGMSIDPSVSFGVEIGSSRSLANRLGSALLAAEQAGHDGLKWKYYDPDSLQDASWKLSMLSQLDEAIDGGQVSVAYQPKIDLKTRKIIGAEALARWTHPTKGPIAAAEFVAAAEQNDRIGKLTAFVLDEAIAAAASLNKGGRNLDISVNLSGRLLGDKALVGRIAILLERHGLSAANLTLELTETAAIAGSGEALDMLTQLRELGVQISIDDYGTGLSTLDYLKRIPASEIKIDQSFIRGMVDNRSERLMVSSTIALAHSLGRRIVAEGVETREALELLAEMECDIAQGYITGRPMSLDSLRRRLASDRAAKVA